MLHLQHHHDNALIILSLVMAMFASYTALDLANSISLSQGRIRWIWLLGGSLAMGVGIWSMHFIGMLAFSLPGVDIAYDVPLLILSILVAICASFLTLFVVAQKETTFLMNVAGSLFMGAAIAGMHYIGIWSMRLPAIIEWDYNYVWASIAIAVGASYVALVVAFKLKHDLSVKGFLSRGLGGVILGLAIAGMHYTAMAAMSFTMIDQPLILDEQLLATNGLAAAVIVGTLIILGIALSGSNIDRVLSKKTILNQELHKAIQSRDEFFSIASHELKTPLTSVKLQNQLIQKNLKRPDVDIEKIVRMLNQMDQSVNRINRLVDDMLDIARLQSKKLSLQISEFRLDETIKEVIERLQPLMDEAHCEVRFESSVHVSGEWDKFRIEQVITNILTNAARYGAGKPIEIKIASLGGRVSVSFRDHGQGIPPEDQERIFLRFERAADVHQTRALGLGLYIVKEILSMHSGDIKVISKVGEGSEFVMTLPVAVNA